MQSNQTIIETLENKWIVFKINNKDNRTTLMAPFWCFYC